MKLSLSKLQQLIREEIGAKTPISEAKVNYAQLARIIKIYDNDPTRMVPVKDLTAAGIPTNAKHVYHVVYGQLVGQRDEVDVEYWVEGDDRWEEIDDVERHHPVSVHRPSQD
jgi:hypothetical protein